LPYHNTGVSGIRTDDSRWPLVVITFTQGFTNEDLERCFEANAELFERGEKFVTLRDLRNVMAMPTPVQREMARRWQARVRDELPRLCLGVAIVSDSAFIRGLVTAIAWASAPVIPEETVPTLSAGVDWCLHLLEENGVKVPFSLRRYAVDVTDLNHTVTLR
jgi:hypothetical protein